MASIEARRAGKTVDQRSDIGLFGAVLFDTLSRGRSPTLTAAATEVGVILGTAAYMSPEQAGGTP